MYHLALMVVLTMLHPQNAQASCLSAWLPKIGRALDPATEPPLSKLAEDMETIRSARALPHEQRQAVLHDYASPVYQTWFARSFVVMDWIFAGIAGLTAVQGFQAAPEQLVGAAVAVPLTLYLADLGSQIFHKWLDSYASEEHWFWGSTARAFRQHHEVPNNLNHIDYMTNITPAAQMLAPLFLALSLAHLDPTAQTSALLFLMSILHTTEFHKQAHMKKPNALFALLQKLHLSLGHAAHMKHHKPPFEGEFAVFNGWSNGLTRRIELWKRFDRLF